MAISKYVFLPILFLVFFTGSSCKDKQGFCLDKKEAIEQSIKANKRVRSTCFCGFAILSICTVVSVAKIFNEEPSFKPFGFFGLLTSAAFAGGVFYDIEVGKDSVKLSDLKKQKPSFKKEKSKKIKLIDRAKEKYNNLKRKYASRK